MIMKCLLVLGLLLTPISGWGAIAIDGASIVVDAPSTAGFSRGRTVANIANRVLLVAVAVYAPSGQTVVGVNWNISENFTLLGATTQGDTRIEMWGLVNPTAGTHSWVVQLSGTTQASAGDISLNGVDQTTPFWAVSTAHSTSTTPSVTVASAAGQLVVDAIAVTSAVGAGTTVGAGQTLQYDIVGTGANHAESASSTQPGATSVTDSYTLNNNWNWAMIGVPVNPVGGGTQGGGGSGPCVAGTNCYCDNVRNSTHPLYDPNLLACADFEAPTLTQDVGFGNGPPFYGPPYDDTGNTGDRGVNGYWNRTYTPGSGVDWLLGEPTTPARGHTCAFGPPQFQSCSGLKQYDPTDRWTANAYSPAVHIVRSGEFGTYIPGETAPTGNSSGVSGPFDGAQSLGYLVTRNGPLGILGGINWPGGTRHTFAVTQAMAMASNMEAQNPVINTNWKFAEWSSSGIGPGDGIFIFGLGGTLDTIFPFYQFSFFNPPACPGCTEAQQNALCNANIANATVLHGALACDAAGNLTWKATSADYVRAVDWPLGTWGCIQGAFTNVGLANAHVQLWFTGPAGVQKTLIDFTANMTAQNAANGYNAYTFNAYANTQNTGSGGIPQGPTARYEDNIHITGTSTPPTCASIGFGGGGSGSTPPAAPTGLTVQ